MILRWFRHRRLLRVKRKLARDGWEPTNLLKKEWAFLEKNDPDLHANLKSLQPYTEDSKKDG
jgi:hypothetical protein